MDITKLIGNTPMAEIEYNGRTLLCKLEKYNLTGSIKDRPALGMILAAQKEGKLVCGKIVEPTSGNTGIGLAAIGAAMGYEVVLTMPESMSVERRKMITAYGAKVVLTPAEKGMAGAIEAAKQIEAEGAFMPMQFENPANPASHRVTAGEILRDAGKIDAFVATVGSGGTFTGTARVLREKLPKLLCVAVEPAESAVLSGKKPGPHKIQGIGAGFVPKNYDPSLADRIVTVKSDDAIAAMKTLGAQYGLSVGISSGAAFEAMKQVADSLPEGARVCGIFPDDGDRYLS